MATLIVYPSSHIAEHLREIAQTLANSCDQLEGGGIDIEDATGISSEVMGCVEGLADWLRMYNADIRPASGLV